MRYTAIALDYDGTIAHDGVVPPHVLDGLARLKATGVKRSSRYFTLSLAASSTASLVIRWIASGDR